MPQLKMDIIIHDQFWPQVSITVQRESMAAGRVVVQDKIQYDLAYGKAEVMIQNQLRIMIEEIVKRRKQSK